MSTTDDERARAALKPVKSADRVLEILELVSTAAEPLTVTELHRRSGYPRSSLHQLLHTMAARGWIDLSADGYRVAVGTRALLVGTSYLDHDRALAFATPVLEQVRDETGYTAHYARLEGSNVIYLATREASASQRRASRVGRSLPANATALGKALLAELTSAEVAATLPPEPLPALTGSTVTTVDRLQHDLEIVRADGWAQEHEENTEGVACVAVAVGYRIPATDALSCSIPVEHADDAELGRVADVLLAARDDLTRALRREGVR